MKKLIILFLIILFPTIMFSQYHKMQESYYIDYFSTIIKGHKEFFYNKQTVIDIITDTFAIKVNFIDKWAESIGLSLFYSDKTGKRPGIVLIVDGISDDEYIRNLMVVAAKEHISVWLIDYNTNKWCKIQIFHEYVYKF